ncbi:MAG TPA: flippase [bacterium]|nr:flippase [bacterium]
MDHKESQERLAFRILNNSAALIGGEFFYHFINFLAGIMIARSLGTQTYGMFSFIFVYLSFFEIFIQFGMNAILQREIVRNKEYAPKILGNAVILRLILTAIAVIAAIFLIRWLKYPVTIQTGVWLAAFQLFLGLRSVYEVIFRVNLLMFYPAFWNGIRALLNLMLVAAVMVFSPGISYFIAAYLISGVTGLLGIAFFSRRFVSFSLQWDWRLMKDLAMQSAPLMAASYLTLLYYRIDVFMLSKMKSFADVGYYSVATRLTEALDIVSTALTASLFPLLARSFKENRLEFERLVRKAFAVLLLAGLPVALGGGFVARELVIFLFGQAYLQSSFTLMILFWYSFFGFFSTLLVNLLIICGRQIVDVWVSLILIMLNVAMNLWLIPLFSYNGAAGATVLTEIIGMTFMLVYAVKHQNIRLPVPGREVVLSLRVNAFFFLGLCGMKMIFHLPFYVYIPLAALFYFSLLLMHKIINLEDCRSYVSGAKRHFRGIHE